MVQIGNTQSIVVESARKVGGSVLVSLANINAKSAIKNSHGNESQNMIFTNNCVIGYVVLCMFPVMVRRPIFVHSICGIQKLCYTKTCLFRPIDFL